MRKVMLAAMCAAPIVMLGGQASAAVVYAFGPGLPTPSNSFTVIDFFADASGVDSGVNYQIKTPPSDPNGAPPANSSPAGTSYLSVLGGGNANINFTSAVTAFQFDWGSVDTYNTLTIHLSVGPDVVLTGSNVTSPANGNQVAPGTNGRFTVFRDDGVTTFTGFSMASSQNSFEIDNLAVANSPGTQNGIPEPATWAMMIAGFAGVGGVLRRRRLLLA